MTIVNVQPSIYRTKKFSYKYSYKYSYVYGHYTLCTIT